MLSRRSSRPFPSSTDGASSWPSCRPGAWGGGRPAEGRCAAPGRTARSPHAGGDRGVWGSAYDRGAPTSASPVTNLSPAVAVPVAVGGEVGGAGDQDRRLVPGHLTGALEQRPPPSEVLLDGLLRALQDLEEHLTELHRICVVAGGQILAT